MAREHARRAKARRRARADIFYTRARSYQEDALANLRNVAIPGTGVPLSLLARSKPLAYLFFVFAYPFVCAMAAANKARAARLFAVAPQRHASLGALRKRAARAQLEDERREVARPQPVRRERVDDRRDLCELRVPRDALPPSRHRH